MADSTTIFDANYTKTPPLREIMFVDVAKPWNMDNTRRMCQLNCEFAH